MNPEETVSLGENCVYKEESSCNGVPIDGCSV